MFIVKPYLLELTRIQEYIVTCSISEGMVGPEEQSFFRVGCWVCDSWRCWNINGDDLYVCIGIKNPDESASGRSSKLKCVAKMLHITFHCAHSSCIWHHTHVSSTSCIFSLSERFSRTQKSQLRRVVLYAKVLAVLQRTYMVKLLGTYWSVQMLNILP